MNLLIGKWNEVINFGVSANLTISKQKKILLTNQISLTIGGICFFFLIYALFFKNTPSIFFNLILSTLYLPLPWLNKKKFYDITRLLTIYFLNLGLFFYVGSISKSTDSHISFFVLSGLPLLLFEAREKLKITSCILLPIVLFSILAQHDFVLFNNYFGELPPHIAEFTYLFNFLFVILSMLYLFNGTQKAEYQIERNKNFLESLINNLPVMFSTKDQKGEYVLVNREFEQIFQKKQEDVIGKEDKNFLSAEALSFCTIHDSELLKKEKTITYQATLKDRDEVHTYICTKFSIPDHNNQIIFLCQLAFDITYQIKVQKALETERERSMHAMKMAALGEMAGGMAHEINNPLAVISLLSEQLKKLAYKDGFVKCEKVEESTGKIFDTTQRIANIVKALRTFSSQAEGNPMVITDVRNILNDTLQLCRERLLRNNINLILEMEENSHQVLCRPGEISQVILNLINNAADALVNIPNPEIKIQLFHRQQREVINVIDNGPGIEPQYKDKIFDPFFTTKTIGQGTGLGLSVSKGILESHYGNISVNSSRDGTLFKIELPTSSH